ncbi:MAG: VOC family protein [Pseudohongiellaceae bacterium]
MFTHVCVGTNDLQKSKEFYDAVLGSLGIENGKVLGDRGCMYSHDGGNFLVLKPSNGEAATYANGGTIGFVAAGAAAVDAAYTAGMNNGGNDEGEPGKRPNAPGNAYGAYLRDPMGNKLSFYCQLPEGE